MKASFRFLGTGGSGGVPLIGCKCAVCRSSSSFNKRLRSAGLFTIEDKHYLIDVGPDFREQALRYQIDRLNGVMITHAHSDHIVGIDDLRAYYFLEHKKVPCLVSQETFDEIKKRFPYLLESQSGGSISAQLDFRILDHDFGERVFEGLRVRYLSYFQVGMKVTGFRVGDFAYVSDIRTFTDEVFESLKGVEILVLSALRHEPTAMHFSIEEAIAFSRQAGAKTTYFTHIAHDLDHETAQKILPKGFYLSYDGLQIEIEVPNRDIL
jgi:phosphoribosyl 1,2-cyclic phosphate phosphodiesterase